MSCSVVKLTQKLIQIPSISPKDLGCQDIIIKRLSFIGFKIKSFYINETRNLWAYRGSGKTLTFAGHTDVVSPGEYQKWCTNPFFPVIRNGVLFGRGASDMKGALAAMIVAVENFVNKNPHHNGRISFLITSDEESDAKDGTVKVVEYLLSKNDYIDYCIVGEPSSIKQVGDVVKNGRRGSITAHLIIHGIQGHIAYPELADNPIHKSIPIIEKILSIKLDSGNVFFSPSSINISNINAGYGSFNVIPDSLSVMLNIRFNTEISVKTIKQKITSILNESRVHYSIKWYLSAEPFLSRQNVLSKVVINSIKLFNNQIQPSFSTSGGTSDGRFISLIGSEIIELGLLNKTIHKINECVKVDDLKNLTCIYENIMTELFI